MSDASGKLYVVSTPIGNRGDITYRAVEVLKSVDFVICEDTRHSGALFDFYGIQKPLESFFEGNENRKTPRLAERLAAGENAALVTDAGTPVISDPGYRLVCECVRRGVEVVSVPGPSALLSALSISGLPTDAFVFEGFMPPKSGARRKRFEGWKNETRTVIFYESCHRIVEALEDMEAVLGNVRVVVARELTKKFEEVVRLRVKDAAAHFGKQKPLGEFVVLFNLKMEAKEKPA